MNIGAVIVAAGMSTRMKKFKQLLKIGDMTMAERVVTNFQRAGVTDIVMVTGYQSDLLIKSGKKLGITFLKNEQYETTEMLDSAKIGLEFLRKRCDKILFCPVDIPLFSVDTVKRLIAQDGRYVIPVYNGRRGHPILLDSSVVEGILAFQGDRGLKGALDFLGISPDEVPVDDEGISMDADTEEDYLRMIERHNASLMRPQLRISLAGRHTFWEPELVNLLREIETSESVRDACIKTGISYSKGWHLIQSAESELGYPIVIRHAGGREGGNTILTEDGREMMRKYSAFEKSVRKAADERFREIFGEH